jgi:hypothetical protein
MLVIDSQIHIWQNALPPNLYHRQISSYSYDDALREMDEAGVDAALFHPPARRWDPRPTGLSDDKKGGYGKLNPSTRHY